MKIEEINDLVIAHDKHIDLMAQSIENLATAVGASASKLDDLLDIMHTQNLLTERMENMDKNLQESFTRVHNKIRDMEKNQNSEGCSVLKGALTHQNDLEDRIKSIESTVTWSIRGMLGSLLAGLTTFVFTHLK